MEKEFPTISLLFGFLGMLFVIMAATEVICDCVLPSLILVLFHLVMVLVAFPFFLYSVYKFGYHDQAYFIVVGIISVINAIMMYTVSYIDPNLSDMFYIAAILELIPLPIISLKLTFTNIDLENKPQNQ